MNYISGDFYEGEFVTVEFQGKVYRRKVRYSRFNGLYIVIKGWIFFESECRY